MPVVKMCDLNRRCYSFSGSVILCSGTCGNNCLSHPNTPTPLMLLNTLRGSRVSSPLHCVCTRMTAGPLWPSLVLMLQTQTSLSSVYVENPLNLEMQRLDKTKNQFEFALICSSSTHQEWNLDSKFILSLFGPFFLSPIVKNMTRNA